MLVGGGVAPIASRIINATTIQQSIAEAHAAAASCRSMEYYSVAAPRPRHRVFLRPALILLLGRVGVLCVNQTTTGNGRVGRSPADQQVEEAISCKGSRRTGLANPLRQHHSGGIATSLLVRPGQRHRQGGQRARHAPDLEGGAKAPRRGPERRRARSKKKRRRSAGGKPAHMKRASGSPKRRSPRALDLRLKHQTPSGTPG